MLAKDLIAKLQEADPDEEVYIDTFFNGEPVPVKVQEVEFLTGYLTIL